MVDTPRSYAAFQGAGRAIEQPVHDADPQLIGTVQIIEAISRAPYRGPRKAGLQGDAYSTDPLGSAREAERCDNNQRNKPTYDQQGYMSAAGPASVSRTTCPLNIHEPPPPYAPRKPRRGGERDVAVRGAQWAYCDSIDLSCTLCRSIISRFWTVNQENRYVTDIRQSSSLVERALK